MGHGLDNSSSWAWSSIQASGSKSATCFLSSTVYVESIGPVKIESADYSGVIW